MKSIEYRNDRSKRPWWVGGTEDSYPAPIEYVRGEQNVSRNLHNMTQSEIEAIIFEDAGVYEPRGLRDRLTVDEIVDLPKHPAWQDFDPRFQDWVWSAIGAWLEEGDE